jgi:hypothetical protein
MKTIIMIRHGRKNGEHISEDCLEEIRKNGIPGVGTEINKIHRGSCLVRTWETARAFEVWLVVNGGVVQEPYLDSDSRFGSDELITEILAIAPDFLPIVKVGGVSEFEALERTAPPERFQKWSGDLFRGILDVFDKLEPDDVCLSSGHRPFIEMTANVALGGNLDRSTSLRELEGFRFVQRDDGSVVVDRI